MDRVSGEICEILLSKSNTANKGGAIHVESGSTMKLAQNASVFFVDNHANLYGGAIYLRSRDDSYRCDASHPECFLQLDQYDSHKTVLKFMNNSAVKGGDVMYGKLNDACLLLLNNISTLS